MNVQILLKGQVQPNIPMYELKLPGYDVSKPLNQEDFKRMGAKIDKVIKSNYLGKETVLRSISSSMKQGTLDEVVEQISRTGTDYDVHGKKFKVSDDWKKESGADLFGAKVVIREDSEMIYRAIKAFYELPKDEQGQHMPQKADVIMIYDSNKLEQITYSSKRTGKVKNDAYNFLDKDNKQGALLGIIKIV